MRRSLRTVLLGAVILATGVGTYEKSIPQGAIWLGAFVILIGMVQVVQAGRGIR